MHPDPIAESAVRPDAMAEPVGPEPPDPEVAEPEVADPEPFQTPPAARGDLIGAIALYTVLRLGLMAVLTVALMFVMPLIVALAFAVVLQLPLALLLFRGPRHRLTAALARARSRRSAERDRLRAALLGDAPGPAD